jgi:Skp family chaperone for outer membrane proteins
MKRYLLATSFGLITLVMGLTLFAHPHQAPPTGQAPAHAASPAPQPARIAIIDSRTFDDDGGIQQLLEQIQRTEESFRERTAALQKLQQEVQSLQRDLQAQWANLTPQARERRQDELEEKQRRFQRESEDYQRDVERALRKATDPIREKIFVFLTSYAKTRGYTLVLDQAVLSQAGALLYVDPSLDVTRDFITEFNRANPPSR